MPKLKTVKMVKFKFTKNVATLLKMLPTLATIKDCRGYVCADMTMHDTPLSDFNALKAWCLLNDMTFVEREETRPDTRYTEVEKGFYYVLSIYKGSSNVCTFFSVNYSR